MLDRLRELLLRVLRVPAEPQSPPGTRDAQVFRASPRFYSYRLLVWALAQTGTLAGLVTGLLVLRSIPGLPDFWRTTEAFAWAGFLAQLPVTYAALRLDFELRWYIVTDRSLRIREGLATIREQTMTFANIQNIAVRQNPLQRLLGIADVEVKSAGGGGRSGGAGSTGRDMHVGAFHGVDHADAIRAAVLERVRLHRDAGLGDPDDDAAARPRQDAGRPVLLEAARELANEARALRLELRRSAG